MINRLEAIEKRYNEISNELTTEEVIKDVKKMTELSKEQRRLSKTVEIYDNYIISSLNYYNYNGEQIYTLGG